MDFWTALGRRLLGTGDDIGDADAEQCLSEAIADLKALKLEGLKLKADLAAVMAELQAARQQLVDSVGALSSVCQTQK